MERHGAGAVLEIGAGTGIFTQQITGEGVRVVPVEPVLGMRQRLVCALPTVDVRDGTAEALPVEDDSYATVVAQSFHWFDSRPALDEIHRVLHRGGQLVTVWNVKNGDAGWFQDYMEIIDRHADDTLRHAAMSTCGWWAAIDGGPRGTSWSTTGHVDFPRPMDGEG